MNAAGFTATTIPTGGVCRFDSAYITMNTSTTAANTVGITANKVYNFTGYSKLIIIFRLSAKNHATDTTKGIWIGKNATIETYKWILTSNNLVGGTTYTISIPLVDFQRDNYTPILSFCTRNDTWQIQRIRLEKLNIKKGVTILGIGGTWEGYVGDDGDIYYRGMNRYGFTEKNTAFGTLYLRTNYMEVRSGTDASSYIFTQTTVNISTIGYSKITVTYYVEKMNTSTKARKISISVGGKGGDTISFTRSATGTTLTQTLDISSVQYSDTYINISFYTLYDAWRVRRIRFEK